MTLLSSEEARSTVGRNANAPLSSNCEERRLEHLLRVSLLEMAKRHDDHGRTFRVLAYNVQPGLSAEDGRHFLEMLNPGLVSELNSILVGGVIGNV